MVHWRTGVLVTKECLHPALSPPAPSSTEQQILVTFGALLRLYTTDILLAGLSLPFSPNNDLVNTPGKMQTGNK